MSELINEFHAALIAAGYNPRNGKIEADDKWHDAYAQGESGNKCHGTYSIKIIDDDFAIGCFFDRRDQSHKIKWHSKSKIKLTADERARRKRELKEYTERKEKEIEARHKRLSILLTRAYKKLPKFDVEKHKLNGYCARKKILPHGVKYRKKGCELIIPIYGADGRVFSIQRILPNGRKFLFLGGKKKGNYFPFVSKGEDLSIILICEGFATGATIRQATGLPVAAAIDSGNLVYVLASLKLKFPKSRFVLCADNDAWTFNESKRPKDIIANKIPATDKRWEEWRDAGMLWNVGIDKARQAAATCGGAFLVAPSFHGLPTENKPTDFNDLAALSDESIVAAQIMVAVNAIPVRGEAAEGKGVTRPDQQPLGGEFYSQPAGYLKPDYPEPEPKFEPAETRQVGDFGMPFRCLGHYCGTYYYYSFLERAVIPLRARDHMMSNFMSLGTYDDWRNNKYFNVEEGKTSDKKIVTLATSAMIGTCQQRGVYMDGDVVRGAGAWIDKGRVVVNCGKKLFVDGNIVPLEQIESDYIYMETKDFMKPYEHSPLTNSEAIVLRKICEMVTWENPISGLLLAGWCVIAPVCGALEYSKGMEYRPHIWITGIHESGKSTVINRIVRVVLGKIGIYREGETSEAAIRSKIKHDARPIVIDEGEKNNTIEGIISLARIATTGGTIEKFGQGECRIRFAACFSSINPPVSKSSDLSRISFLRIRKNTRKSAMADYDKITRMIDENITEEFSNRLLARTIENMKTLLANIKTFQRAARRVVKSARASEQIGTIVAGLYLLHTTNEITEEAAYDWIKQYNWSDHTAIDHKSEPEKMLQYLAGFLVRANLGGITKDTTIGELIFDAYNKNDEDKFLRRQGIAREGSRVYFATRHDTLKRIFKGTDWGDSYASRLSELDGAEKYNNSFYFTNGVRTSAVSVPVSYFTNQLQGELPVPPKREEPQKTYEEAEEIPLDD